MSANEIIRGDFIFLTDEEQEQLTTLNKLAIDAKNTGRNSCTWYNLNENVVKQLEQFGCTVKREFFSHLELFIIYLPKA